MTEEVLVAEDNVSLRQLIRSAFEDHYRVGTVPDGQTTWELLMRRGEDPPDAVVLDVVMPEVNGFSLLERLRREPAFRDVPILIISGRSREEDIQRAIDAGATDFVTKPFDPTELRDRVGRAIDATSSQCTGNETVLTPSVYFG